MLRAKKPSLIEKRLKLFLYGVAGSGKTMAAIQFPKPYLIDCEKGAENKQYVELLEKNGGVVFQSTDFDEIMSEVKSLLTEKHDYKTLIIDPFTIIYNNLVDSVAFKVGSDFGKHYNEAAKIVKRLFDALLRLDMNVIVTSHSKTEYGKDMIVLGQTFDCYKKSDYLFDLVIEIQKRAKDRVGIIKKSRVSGFDEGDQFPFSYQHIAAIYGREILERDFVPVQLASAEKLTQLRILLDVNQIDGHAIDLALQKAKAEEIDDLPSEYVDKWITHLLKKQVLMEAGQKTLTEEMEDILIKDLVEKEMVHE